MGLPLLPNFPLHRPHPMEELRDVLRLTQRLALPLLIERVVFGINKKTWFLGGIFMGFLSDAAFIPNSILFLVYFDGSS